MKTKIMQDYSRHENLLNGTVTDQVKIAKQFEVNFKILENMKKERLWGDKPIYIWDHVTEYFMSAVFDWQNCKYIIIIIIIGSKMSF